jgi:hypothetical protein
MLLPNQSPERAIVPAIFFRDHLGLDLKHQRDLLGCRT